MSCEPPWNFDQWETFSKKFKPIRVLYKVYYSLLVLYSLFIRLPKIIVIHDFSPSLFNLRRGILHPLTKWVF